ncbi:unnamed protein product [Rotaria sp. Silwood1]|nr:unnamed protein product [Rotaria sp. Silwood1]CAF4782861.1 unnamed protein product [Rotaria sp. Silwood1]
MSKTSSSSNSFDPCIICSSKYNRIRQSLCQCKHCSASFCFDCMKDHNDELEKILAQVSDRHNELKELINTKKLLIQNETMKSKQQLTKWLKTYIDNLTVEKSIIDMNIDKAEKDAQNFILDIESELQAFSHDTQVFTKNSVVQSEHMMQVLEKLNELIQRLTSLVMTREYDLPSTMPQYIFKFNYSSKSTTKNSEHTSNTSQNQNQKSFNTNEQSNTEENYQSDSSLSDEGTSTNANNDFFFPDENYFCNRNKFESTSYIVNCMASDGINIMYSTIEDAQHERIAYCYLDEKNSHYRQVDPQRIWNQSRIIDMIWWKSINKFICATKNGIYTIKYFDKCFRILNVINNRWTRVCVAANTNHIWIYADEKINIYNISFQLVRLINFKISRSLTCASFCITDNFVAFALIRRIENDRDLLQIEFYDSDMKKIKRVRLGLSETSCLIRTDGNNRFYVAMGQQRFYIVSPNGNKQIINLGKQASCLAVVNSRNIVLTKLRSELELVTC